jgi:uncharacterized membrane protein YphA (DoxX/SURF4 family)
MKNRGAIAVIGLVQAVIGYEWVKAGWEKIIDPNFVTGMAKTLGVFASKNPTTWYKDLLTGTGIPNATTLGWLIAYGEFLVGIALLVAAAVYLFYGAGIDPVTRWIVPIGAVVALIGGAFMSANFWFAAGWLSVSTDSVNAVMFLTQLVLAGMTIYFLTQPVEEVPDEELAWRRLFNSTPAAEPAPKEPIGIAH